MTIWVVGAKGLVGSELVKQCQDKRLNVLGTGHAELDMCQLPQVLAYARQTRPAYIVNCAAYTDVDGAEKNAALSFSVNAQGAEHIALAAREVGAQLLHISTDYVFDGKSTVPYKETDLCSPLNVYGQSKWEGEQRVLAVCPLALIVRTSWVFGKKGKNFVSSLLQRFSKEKELKVVEDQVGKPTYCADLVEALLLLLGKSGVVHFANEGGMSRYDIACQLLQEAKRLGLSALCDTILPTTSASFPRAAVRPDYSVLDTTKYTLLTKKRPRPWLEAARELILDAL